MFASSSVSIRNTLGLILALTLPHAAALNQVTPASVADSSARVSSPTYDLEEIVITSARIPATLDRSPAPVSLISRSAIERSGASSLSEILSMGPGLFIKDYGTASGIKTIAQRGLAAEHTLVLLDGMPVNSLQNGSLDVGTIPAEEIDRVEIVRGGQSASFGANAVAGVVNIVTRAAGTNLAAASLGVGSFGERNASLSVGNRGEDVEWRIAGGVRRLDGNYPYDFSDGRQTYRLSRENAGSRATRLSGNTEASLSSTVRLRASALYIDSERGVPGFVTSRFAASRSTQWDRQAILQTGLVQTLAPGSWWEAKIQGGYSYQRYADPDLQIGGVQVDNYFRSVETRAEAQYHGSIIAAGRFTLGGDCVYAAAEGNSVSGADDRRQAGFFAAGEIRIGVRSDSVVLLSIHPALRYDYVKNVDKAFSPQCGVQVLFMPVELDGRVKHAIRFHGTLGRNFRTPTFNELYYSGGGGIGNPALRPERSVAYDLGFSVTVPWLGHHEFDATAFGVHMDDRILWTTAGQGIVTPKNIRTVRSRGFELTYSWELPAAGATVSMAYTRCTSEKISADFPGDQNINTLLPYSPQELLNCQISWGGDLQLGAVHHCGMFLGVSRTGFRYTTEDNSSFLPGYALLNAGMSLELQWLGVLTTLRADVRNIFEESYAVMQGYPMPLRSFTFTFAVAY